MYEVVIKKHIYYALIALFFCVSFVYKDSFIKNSCMTLVSYVNYPLIYSYAFIAQFWHNWHIKAQDKAALKVTIEQLEAKNSQLQAELVAARAARVYDDSIKEIRLFKERYNLKGGIVAQVLSITSTDYEQTIMVNAGFHHGIVKNMVVLAHNCLLGKVVEVYPWYAKVRLITDARCKVSAVCACTGASGIHQGNNTDLPTLEHVSHLETVTQGDIILSTGKGRVFPQGFALGTVVQSTVDGLVHKVTVQPLFSLKNLSYCMLISKELCEKH